MNFAINFFNIKNYKIIKFKERFAPERGSGKTVVCPVEEKRTLTARRRTLDTSRFLRRRETTTGQAALTAVMFFLFVSVILIAGFVSFSAGQLKAADLYLESKRSFIFAEGAVEDAIYRIKNGVNMPSLVFYSEAGLSATTTVSGTSNITIAVESASLLWRALRKEEAIMAPEEGIMFSLASQVGEGGLLMSSNSRVNGSVYVNGDITGSSGSIITGNAYAAGVISSPSPEVGGAKQENAGEMALPEVDIDYWKQEANQNRDPIDGDYELSAGTHALGPKKINGNFKLKGNSSLTLTGPLHITGKFQMSSNASIHLDNGFSGSGTAIIAEGQVELDSNTVIYPTASEPKGYVLLLSEKSGSEPAIVLNGNSSSGIIYAVGGTVQVNSNASAVVMIGYGIEMNSNAEINYDSGIQDYRFENGPSVSWVIGSWKEIE